jgi:acetolactate synthase-1/2/3 large subunit
MKVAEYVMARLAFLGVGQAYCVTGGAAMHLNDALGGEPGIAVRYLHHEQACAIAGEGYARTTGQPALVQVTAGPGSLNALNGVFGAFTDSVPMIVVSGQVRTDTLVTRRGPDGLRQLGDQELRTVEVVRPVAKWVEQAQSAFDVPRLVDEAWLAATTGRPGPAWIDIPIDIQGADVDADPTVPLDLPSPPAPDTNSARAIVELLLDAHRPVILAGTGVRVAEGQDALVQTVEALQVPLVTAWTHDLIDSGHPLYAGRPGTIGTRAGNMVVQAADLVVVLGSRLNIRQVSYNWQAFAADARLVIVDIDPAEPKKHYLQPDEVVVADLRTWLPALRDAASEVDPSDHAAWLRWIAEVRAEYEPTWDDYPERPSGINAYHAIMELGRHVTPEHVVVSGDATACIVPFQVLPLPAGARLFSNSGCASMGHDLPAAIGAADGRPDARVVCLAGDGSVMMNLQELQSLRDSGRDIALIILDNDGYLSIKQTQRNFFGRDFGSAPSSGVGFPDFAAVAAAFGLPVTELTLTQDWQSGLGEFIDASGPRVCVVHLDTEQEFEPRLKSRMTEAGIVTPPLDDMYPHLPEETLERVRREAIERTS